ncbi:tyrosine-type recombinase/integrase [Thauera butanivorans]|uniref:tyrosine-type recombinase/integrase n=1 Tax=Thauera butanivorans TaxID=86174 RepID=UPI003AB446C2
MPKLTKSYVERLPAAERETFVWDDEIKGFGLKLFPSGARSFVFQYRTPEGKVRRLTIGKFSDALTADQARRQAKGYALEVHGGRDPQGEKQERRRALTLGKLFDEYLDSEAFLGKAESTRAVDRGRIERHLRPLVATEYVDRLTAEAVKRMHRQIIEGKTAARIKTGYRGLARVSGGKGTADKSVLMLSAIYKWAQDQGLAKSNPAGNMKCWKTGTRDTILETPEQYRQLFTALQDLENEKRIRPAAADAIRFIALTGARRGEAVGLRWRYVDLKNGQVVLPPHAHKTGKKTGKPRIIGLPTEAQAIIARQADGDPDDYVFSPNKGAPIALNKDWPKVREQAKLPSDLGLHGLRHSIGTALAMSGASAVELMELLGHRQISTTMRYVHFAERARSTLAERAAAVALAGMKPEEGKAEVIPLKKGAL